MTHTVCHDLLRRRRLLFFAYDAQRRGQWKLGAWLWTLAASSEHGAPSDFAQAACCVAEGGHFSDAIAILGMAARQGFHDVELLATHPAFDMLRLQPSWPAIYATTEANRRDWELSLPQPELRKTLLAMLAVDQEARRRLVQGLAGASPALETVDRQNLAKLKTLVNEHGWPGRSSIGADGASAIWALAQHADGDIGFQLRCLALLGAATVRGEAKPQHYAYLEDRIAVSQGRAQRYGTQLDDSFTPRRLLDADKVDAYRRSVFLPPLEDYIVESRALYQSIRKK